MLKIGITGNIAAGKSCVEKMIKESGFLVYDLDEFTHLFFDSDEEIKALILKEFQTLDRKKIADIIFSDKEKKEKLENIIHPKLKIKVLELFEKFKNENLVFVSGALLFKSGFNQLFDKIIYVDSDFETRLERLKKRNNLSDSKARSRLNSQSDKYKNQADYIILNNSDLNSLKLKVETLLCDLQRV